MLDRANGFQRTLTVKLRSLFGREIIAGHAVILPSGVAQFQADEPPAMPRLTCGGLIDEWHLNHDKPFRHIAFELGAGFSQVREVPVVSFPSPGLVAIWAVGDAVGGDGVE